ncbi:hypothetical protein L2E82_51334 [Cichorium intybus]|nr:hypothetical protein L2E82_51334 [Cichorium intybus]
MSDDDDLMGLSDEEYEEAFEDTIIHTNHKKEDLNGNGNTCGREDHALDCHKKISENPSPIYLGPDGNEIKAKNGVKSIQKEESPNKEEDCGSSSNFSRSPLLKTNSFQENMSSGTQLKKLN